MWKKLILCMVVVFVSCDILSEKSDRAVNSDAASFELYIKFNQIYRGDVKFNISGKFLDSTVKFLNVKIFKDESVIVSGIYPSDSIQIDLKFINNHKSDSLMVEIRDPSKNENVNLLYSQYFMIRSLLLDSIKNTKSDGGFNILSVPTGPDGWVPSNADLYAIGIADGVEYYRFFSHSPENFCYKAKVLPSDIFVLNDVFVDIKPKALVYRIREMTCVDSLLETVKP